MKSFTSFLVGFLFSIGLGYSGMTQPHVVKGFLDILGNWNPALTGVMIGAILVHAVAFQFIKKKNSPLLDSKFYLPTNQKINKRLFLGAALFGLGWGWAGICPGPAITSLASARIEIVVFVAFMILGMLVFKFVESKKR